MSSPDNSPTERLERLVGRALGEQPLRQAPEGFAARVSAAIASRAMLPWWRSAFAHWPLAARVAFPVVCLGLTALTSTALVRLAAWAAQHLGGPLSPPLAGARATVHALATLGELAPHIAGSLPPGWLESVLGIAIVLYVALFGLSAVAYRTLRPHH